MADVKKLCVFISGCYRGHKSKNQQQAIEHLLRGLLPHVYPSSPPGVRSEDQRPLHSLYAKMLSACSPEFVEEVLDSRDVSNPLFRWREISRLMRSHPALFKRRASEYLFGVTPHDSDITPYLRTFLYNDTEFAMEALYGRLENRIDDKRWGDIAELQVLLPILRRFVDRRHTNNGLELQIHTMIKLGLDITAKNCDTHRYGAVELWSMALRRWKRQPDVYEDLLVRAMQMELAGSPRDIPGAYTNASQGASESLKPRLLHLYCLHVPNNGVDIFTSESFAVLAKQHWPREIFDHFGTEQKIRMLKKLYEVNTEYNFLGARSMTSILSFREVASQKNFNVDLFLTLLQPNDTRVRQKAKAAVDDLRKKAAITREQGNRAALAQAATLYAIATGDLDIYGDTIVWQQRFLRDTLTVNRIFGPETVLMDEGVELLSGIPSLEASDLPLKDTTTWTLDVVGHMIRKADNILKTLNQSYQTAKREPSFQKSDWQSVHLLLGRVYEMRMARLERLQTHLGVPMIEVHLMIWKCILSAMHWMDDEHLSCLWAAIISLVGTAGPVFLAEMSRSLLEFGAARRESQDLAKEKDEILERMSYQALIKLARSNKPALASSLIVQTIMDRPDASSWHRELLTIGFLKRLSSKDAHEILSNLATAVGEKLEEQSYVKVGEPEPQNHVLRKSIVKVTTVKYLAKLLHNAEFISKDSAVEVLVELFKNAQHRDIRLAALDSLLGSLDSLCTEAQDDWTEHPTIQKIIHALETVVPVAGSINEQKIPRKEDWFEAETAGVLPEICDVPQNGLPPLMKAILTAVNGYRYPGLRKLQSVLMERIILPIFRQSQVEHGRWLALFLSKYKAAVHPYHVPLTPVAPRTWAIALTSHYPLVYSSLLKDFEKYALHHIKPAPEMRLFNATLRADLELRKSLEVQHWLWVFDRSLDQFSQSETSTLLQILGARLGHQAPLSANYIPVMDIVVQHAKLYLDDYEDYVNLWEDFMMALAPTAQIMQDATKHARWRETYGTVLWQITNEVKTRRKQRKWSILPSPTRQQLWLLPFPVADSKHEDYQTFVRQLDNLLVTLFEDDESQFFRLPDIVTDISTMSKLLGSDHEKCKIAGELGKLCDTEGSQVEAARLGARQASNLVKVEVAMSLFDSCRDPKMIKDIVRQRLVEWRNCESGVIRERVFRWKGGRDWDATHR